MSVSQTAANPTQPQQEGADVSIISIKITSFIGLVL